ncbi:MAG: hypothetical protein JXA73_05540 [Acidobacteria bacterium]|nr:hypothetical protein [Acidobacteriota bacterium]
MNENEAAGIAIASVRQTLGGDDSMFISHRRDVALERELSRCISESPIPSPFIFRTSPEGEEVNGSTITTHLSVEGPLAFIIAVDGSGAIFKIHGTIDSKREIENLARHYRINLTSAEAAISFVRFYITVNPENSIPPILGSAAEVRKIAKAKIYASLGDKTGESLFEKWLQHHISDISELDFNPQISETQRGGFIATFYSLSDINTAHSQKGPVVLRVSLNISSKGMVRGLKFHPLWR